MVYSTLFQKLCLILVIHWTALSGGNSLTERMIIRATYGKHYPEFIYTSESASLEETREKSQTQNLLVETNNKKDATGIEIRHYAPAQSPLLWNLNRHHRRSKRQLPQQVVFLAPSANKTLLASDTLINNILTTLNKTTTTALEKQHQNQINRFVPHGITLTRDKSANVINSDSRNPLQWKNNHIANVNTTLTKQINSQNNLHRIIPNNQPRAAQANSFGSGTHAGFNNQVRWNGVGNVDIIAQRNSNQRPVSLNFNTMDRPGTSRQQAPRQSQISTNRRFANFDPVTSQRNAVAHRILPSNQPTPFSRGFHTDQSLNTFHGRFMRGFEFGTPLLTPQLEQSRTSFDNAPTGRNSWGSINGMGSSVNNLPVLNSGMGLPFQQRSVQGFF